MRILSSLLVAFAITLFLPHSSFAQQSLECDPILGISFPDDESWENAYILQGSDGSAWQRAIVSNEKQELVIKEGETAEITGTGQPNSEVQIFMFAPKRDASGILKKPGTGSTCVKAGKADEKGYFSFPINARIVWGSAGEDLVVDAYTRLEKSWDQYVAENTNQNFYIGTNLPMGKLSVKIEKEVPPEGCQKLCETTDTVLAQKLVPTAESEAFAPGAFDEVGNKDVNIGRTPGEHTFYAGVDGRDDNTTYDINVLQSYGMRAVYAEYIKRKLLGNRNASGVDPGLADISIASLEEAASGTGSASDKTKQLVSSIKSAMTNVDRDQSLKNLEGETNGGFGRNPVYKAKIFGDLLPSNSTDTDWAKTFTDVINFWSGSLTQNECLMKDDNLIWKNVTDRVQGTLPCGEINIQGQSPSLLLNTDEEVDLEPDFTDVKVTYADKLFGGNGLWNYGEGEKDPLYYHYEFTKGFEGSSVEGASCLRPEDVSEYADVLGNQFSLSTEESALIKKELREAVNFNQFYSVSVVNPEDIASRFSWKGNGERLDIAQLFFDVKEEGCTEKAITVPEISFSAERDGFEAGLLEE